MENLNIDKEGEYFEKKERNLIKNDIFNNAIKNRIKKKKKIIY
jgi:hypothetical protein